jgi:hypothetical protein
MGVTSFAPRSSYPQYKSPVPIEIRGCVDPRAGLYTPLKKNSFSLLGIETQFLSCQARRLAAILYGLNRILYMNYAK